MKGRTGEFEEDRGRKGKRDEGKKGEKEQWREM